MLISLSLWFRLAWLTPYQRTTRAHMHRHTWYDTEHIATVTIWKLLDKNFSDTMTAFIIVILIRWKRFGLSFSSSHLYISLCMLSVLKCEVADACVAYCSRESHTLSRTFIPLYLHQTHTGAHTLARGIFSVYQIISHFYAVVFTRFPSHLPLSLSLRLSVCRLPGYRRRTWCHMQSSIQCKCTTRGVYRHISATKKTGEETQW